MEHAIAILEAAKAKARNMAVRYEDSVQHGSAKLQQAIADDCAKALEALRMKQWSGFRDNPCATSVLGGIPRLSPYNT